MAATKNVRHRFVLPWIATWLIPASAQLSLSMWIATEGSIGSATLLFWGVVIAASLCLITALAVLVRAFSVGQADLGFLGLFFFAVAALPLVHGITTPGVLMGPNTSTMNSVLLSIPVGLVATAPFILPRRIQSTWVRRRWRGWIVAWCTIITALAATLLVDIDLLPAPRPRSPLTVTIAVGSLIGCVVLSLRHLHLARVADRRAPLIVAAGYGFVGSSALVWLSTTPFSAGFWSAHVLDVVGAFGATIGALLAYRHTRAVNGVLRPVLVIDPIGALEVGLDPLVHRFVADLEEKDPITRDHVIRTGELAVRVADELRLRPEVVRRIGMAAILHDVGKLNVPDHILNKPGRLNNDEFEIVKQHAVHGWQLVSTSTTLRPIAAGVRAHHERIDGTGYPDGLKGEAIPIEARVVAACDAFDAMANTRQYRDGMGSSKAVAILREHAGSQWDPVVVAALVAVIGRDEPSSRPSGTLEAVGRTGCDCLPETLLARMRVPRVDTAWPAPDGSPEQIGAARG